MKAIGALKTLRGSTIAILSLACAIGLVVVSNEAVANANEPAQARNDLRDLRVGMAVTELPSKGYVELDCAEDPAKKLATWSDYGHCGTDKEGRYEINFQFDESTNVLGPLDDKYTGTRVGGHPVILTLFIGADQRVAGLDIKTDPHARLNLRKRAFLLAAQAMNYYGADGWSCKRHEPSADEAPIGAEFIKERCEKTLSQRKVIVERQLYRPINADIKNFVSTSQITVLSAN